MVVCVSARSARCLQFGVLCVGGALRVACCVLFACVCVCVVCAVCANVVCCVVVVRVCVADVRIMENFATKNLTQICVQSDERIL